VSLVAVFIPVLFMGGMVGRLLHEFSVTIVVAILVSGFVSLTLTPMLGSRFLRYRHDARHGRMYRFLEAGFQGLASGYDVTLRGVLRHQFLTVVFLFGLLAGTVYLFFTMPTGFIPSQDSGFVFGITLAGQDISFESLAKHQRVIAQILKDDPNVGDVGAFAMDGNQAFVFARMKPRSERALSVDQIIDDSGEMRGMVLVHQQDQPGSIGFSYSLEEWLLDLVDH
jgi:HAE1 family hydrophobic/amphiphilic exporter-1